MRLLVVGTNGLLGSNVVSSAQDTGVEVVGTYHTEEPEFDVPLHPLDVTDIDRLESVFERTRPDAVVNCAAMTDVDGCEEKPDVAKATNETAPGEMARLCEERDTSFAHVSTDYVFDGRTRTPYAEDDEPNPVQVYGQTKLDGDIRVRENHASPLIARLSFVYGVNASSDELSGFPAWVKGRLEEGQETPLFTDQHVTPTRAGQAASVLLRLLRDGVVGTYNVACRSCVTPYDFGDAVRRRMDAPAELVTEGSMSDVERSAERPTYTCLDVEKLGEEQGFEQPTLKEDLDSIDDHF